MNIIGMYPSTFSEYILTDCLFLFSELPANEKLHDLVSLLNFDFSWNCHELVILISLFLFQANQILELALHLEKTVIDLKINALRMWNVALAGTACGNLSLIENAYG